MSFVLKINNLPSESVTESEIIEYFSGVDGEKTVKIVGNNTLVAFVTFTNDDDLQSALMHDGQEIQGQTIELAETTEQEYTEFLSKNTVVVQQQQEEEQKQEEKQEQQQQHQHHETVVQMSNLPHNVTQQDIEQFFSSIDGGLSIRLEEGKALISFTNPDDVETALLLNGQELNDQQIVIETVIIQEDSDKINDSFEIVSHHNQQSQNAISEEDLAKKNLEEAEKELLRQKQEQEELQLQQQQLEQERIQNEKLEQERLQNQKLEQERLQNEKLEQEKLQNEKLEQERLQNEKLEQERVQNEKLEQERVKNEKLEQEEKQRLLQQEQEQQQQQLEKERLLQQQQEKEQQEKEQLEQQQKIYLEQEAAKLAEKQRQEKLEEEEFQKQLEQEKKPAQKEEEKEEETIVKRLDLSKPREQLQQEAQQEKLQEQSQNQQQQPQVVNQGALLKMMQGINLPAREKIPENDVFNMATSKQGLSIISAAFVFIFIILSLKSIFSIY